MAVRSNDGLVYNSTMKGHEGFVTQIAWSPDGELLAAGGKDKTVHVWRLGEERPFRILRRHDACVSCVAWHPHQRLLASGSNDLSIVIWDVEKGESVRRLELKELDHQAKAIKCVAWSPDDSRLFSGGEDGGLRCWNADDGRQLGMQFTDQWWVLCIAWSPKNDRFATGGGDGSICLWETSDAMKALARFGGNNIQKPGQHIDELAWSPDASYLASASGDKTVRIWDMTREVPAQVKRLEAHTEQVRSVSFSADGSLLASKADDNSVRIWRTDKWEEITARITEANGDRLWVPSIAFHPEKPILATFGEVNDAVNIWDIDADVLLSQTTANSVPYTTAKLVLVGDSGVGKTGLGWRMAHGVFKEHVSTHGQQFWAIPQLGLKRADGTECEAVLWDLAGQHVYRQIHSIFLENIAAALVLFDPTNRQEPLKGVQFWLEQLKGKGQLPPAVLVGARADCGAPALSQQELDQFCQRHGIRGGYLSTSALKGEGLDTLLDTLKSLIPWDEMTATVTTVTFKRIKDYVLTLKEKPDRKDVLVSPLALRERLQATDPDWRFTEAEMMTAVGHLETHGYVAVLRSSAGEQYILLTPDLLVTLASSIVLLVDKHPRELGAVRETELLQGKYPFEELAGLSTAEGQILLEAAILRFLQHNICFRETLGNEPLLIFPGLIKQKRPLQDDLPSTEDISYLVRGRVENLYASLVVLLGYAPSFTRINRWQNQVQYEMGEGEICEFRLIEDREGEIELVLYYGDQLPADRRVKFQELFEQFLHQPHVEVTRFPPVICNNKHQQKRATVIERVRVRKPFMFCDECGDKITFSDFDKPQSIGISSSPWLQREEAAVRLRSAYEGHLTRVKCDRRDWAVPRCYVSHHPEQATWAKEELIHDLRDAGVYVVEQAAQVQPDDFVVVLDTPAYQKAFNTPILAADAPCIRARLDNEKHRLISLALTGRADAHEFKRCKPGSFCDEMHYPVSLFNLVLNLYAVPLTHASFAPLRQALHEQWERTLARKKGDDVTSPLKVFVSYSHKDEEFKEELITMLTGLQRRGIVDAWQDRRIEAGDEWSKSIQDEMNHCDLALLLVSADYLASRFIQEEEQPKLLQLRVIPIIVRPCPWQSEPVLKDLQALPRDNKAIITFSKENGDRDKVWTHIATVIEKRAKAETTP